ncbi:MAG: hypothetical protein M3Y85_11700, partial [Bacteroidota bacterium]|nr:hypothetical protein [Bacteroidota bacterium]
MQRHNVVITKADSLSSLTVGNGRFAFTVDVTGLQTFPLEYSHGVSLGTQSEWGWHSFIDTAAYKREEALKTYHLNKRDITYLVQVKEPDHAKKAADWFRQNPHRLQLGNIGFELLKKDGTETKLDDIKDIHQELDLWTGEIKSHFSLEGVTVDVSTVCHAMFDAIGLRVVSPLIKEGRLKVKLTYPYPTGAWTDEGTNWINQTKHSSSIMEYGGGGTLLAQDGRSGTMINHTIDSTSYLTSFWYRNATVLQQARHVFVVQPNRQQDVLELTIDFARRIEFTCGATYQQIQTSSEVSWMEYWQSGAAIDFSGSTDKRAFELERRIILSQYLMKAQEAGNYPPQETGLT